MASRSRVRMVRYGGEQCGVQSNIGPMFTPAKLGIRSCVDEVHSGPPYRTGGPLNIMKKKFNIKRFPTFSASQGPVSFHGYLSAGTYTPSPEPTAGSLAGWGAKGWNRTVPTHPLYQLGVSLAEMKDLRRQVTSTMESLRALRGFQFSKLGTTVGAFLSDLKKGTKYMADNYLNYQFGWAQTVQDMRFLYEMQFKLSRKLNWLRKQNGKSVRRKVTLDSGSWQDSFDYFMNRPGSVLPLIDTSFYADSSFPWLWTGQRSVKYKIWYSAKYRFWIPNIPKAASKTPWRLKNQFLGLDLDPTTLYKAYRWTWLLDWFTSTGAVVQNLFNMLKFGVVAEYAYVMGSSDYRYRVNAECNINTGTYSFATGTWPGKLYLRGYSDTIYEFRQREAASPFGFGVTLGSLSNFQWSILVALGISKRLR